MGWLKRSPESFIQPHHPSKGICIRGGANLQRAPFSSLEFFPDVFAAIVPAAGGVRAQDLDADRKAFDSLNSIPVWAFHGRQDTIVRISEQQRIVDYLQPSHPNLKFSIDEGGNHFIWDYVYADHDIYSWMLEQHKVSSE